MDQLPEITQEGNNTFGCLSDGETYVPKHGFISSSKYEDVESEYYFQHDTIHYGTDTTFGVLFLRIRNNKMGSIRFEIQNIFSVGYKPLSPIDYVSYKNTYEYYYDINSDDNITIIRYDTTAKIISGTFKVALTATDGSKIKLTDGRFDVNYEE